MTDPLIPCVPAIVCHALVTRWQAHAESYRDKQERYLLDGNESMASAVDLIASTFEVCCDDLRAVAEKAEEGDTHA